MIHPKPPPASATDSTATATDMCAASWLFALLLSACLVGVAAPCSSENCYDFIFCKAFFGSWHWLAASQQVPRIKKSIIFYRLSGEPGICKGFDRVFKFYPVIDSDKQIHSFAPVAWYLWSSAEGSYREITHYFSSAASLPESCP